MATVLTSLTIVFLMSHVSAMDNLRVAYQWKILDFDFPSEEARKTAIERKEFVPENNLPLGLEVYGERLFVTVPRWKSGVAASLTYINMTSDPMESPKLHPYPNWAAHNITSGNPDIIVSPFRIRADRCGRLWVLDTGVADIMENIKEITSPRILIYDLNTDNLIRSYTIPMKQMDQSKSFFANLAVEDHHCGDSYAYLADLGHPALVVYSYKENRSWMVQHNYFHIDPLAGEMNVSGINFQWTDGIFGLALSKPDEEGYSTLFFHPMTSFDEFSVNTKYLRNETLATNSFNEFSRLGTRGARGQSGVSFLDQKTGILFYALVNLNAVACWRTTNKAYTMESQGRIFMSNVSMVFPNDIKVDLDDNLWVLSDRLPTFMYAQLDHNDVNFRILTAKVSDAVRGTTCDSKLVLSPKIMDKISPVLNSSLGNRQTPSSASQINFSILLLSLAVFSIFDR